MKRIKTALLLIAALTVSACASQQTAMRNATPSTQLASADIAVPQAHSQQIFLRDVRIEKVTVDVPRSLKVSEKNSYYPKGDIVWRGDLIGDRYAQIAEILQTSAQRTAAELDGARPVHMHIEVTRFHGLTEKARYSTGGVHNMNFYVTLLDPQTGAVLRPARHVVSNLDALKGDAAVAADMRGETQKVRVTAFLAHVLKTELTRPEGYIDQNSGFFVALNKT